MSTTAEVVVIGGGVMGASILYHLAARGQTSALLLERSALGAGSTGRSSGIIRMHYSTGVHTRLSWASLPVWRNWRDVIGAGDAGFVHTGFIVFAPATGRSAFESVVRMQQACGVRTGLITRQEAREICPGFAVEDDELVAYEPDSGYGDPSGAALGFVTRARELGADARLGESVRKVELSGDRITAVTTDTDRIETETAVVAAGPWTARLMHGIGYDLPLRATRHEVFLLKRSLERLPFHPGGGDMANLCYFRPEGADLTLVGNGNITSEADPDAYPSGVSMDYVADIWPRVVRRVPALESAEFAHGYAGLYTETPDSHPIVDRVEGVEGLYLCTGFSGHGFKLSPAVGEVMAELILDGRARTVDISSLRMSRFAEDDLNEPQTGFRVMV